MPVFEYRQFESPYQNTIAQLIAHSQDARAAAAQQVALANARATEIGGQAWGNAIGAITHAAAGIPEQIIEARKASQVEALNKIRLEQAQQVQGAQRAMDLAGRGDQLLAPVVDPATGAVTEGVGPRLPTMIDKDGAWKIPELNQWLASRGYASQAPALIKQAQDNNDALTQAQEAKQKLAQQNTILYGRMAHTGLTISEQLGISTLDGLDIAAQPGLISGQFSAEDYAKFRSRIAALPEEQQTAALTGMRNQAAQLLPKTTHKENETETDAFGQVTYKGESTVKPVEGVVYKDDKGVEHPARFKDGHYIGADGQNVDDKVLRPSPAPAAPKGLERFVGTLDGKPNVEMLLDPDPKATVKVYDLSGNPITDPASRVRGIPTQPPAAVQLYNLTQKTLGDLPDFVNTAARPANTPDSNKIDPRIGMSENGLWQAAVTQLQTGKTLQQMGRGADPLAQAKQAAINTKIGAIAADAGIDVPELQKVFSANAASLTQLQKNSDAVAGFIRTADANADQLRQLLPQIPDLGSPLLNKPLRELDQKALGNVPLAKFKTFLTSITNEYARIISQPNLVGQLTDTAREEAQQMLNPNATVAQILAALDALKVEGDNRITSIGTQIQQIRSRMTIPGGGGGGGATNATSDNPLGLTFSSKKKP